MNCPAPHHHHGITRPWRLAAWVAIVGQIAIVWLVLWLYLFQGSDPTTFTNLPFPVDKKTYKHGSYIIVDREYCKNYNGAVTMHISFADGLLFDMAPIVSGGAPNGCGTSKFRVQVPETLPAGEYRLIGENIYRVNILRERTVSWETVKFRVVDDERK